MVETPSTNISENLSYQRKTRDGSFCFSTVTTTCMVHGNQILTVGERMQCGKSRNLEISEKAFKLISNTRRQGSLSNYNSSWSKWADWCGEGKTDPFRYAISKVLDYLGYLFHLGYENRTVCCHRSEISAYYEYVDNKKVGQHPHVCALLKGVFNERPPQPRYVFIWDIQTVLDFVKYQWSGCDSSDKVLIYKLVILMALSSAS